MPTISQKLIQIIGTPNPQYINELPIEDIHKTYVYVVCVLCYMFYVLCFIFMKFMNLLPKLSSDQVYVLCFMFYIFDCNCISSTIILQGLCFMFNMWLCSWFSHHNNDLTFHNLYTSFPQQFNKVYVLCFNISCWCLYTAHIVTTVWQYLCFMF